MAAAQFGVVTRAQLGLHSYEITRQVREGRLHRLHPGVYAVGHTVLVPRGRWLAAVLACGRGAALSHGSAAVLHGIWDASARTHVTVRRGAHSRAGIVVHRVRDLHPDDVTTVDGIRVTTVARLALDLAEQVSPHRLGAVLERTEVLRLFDLRAFEATMARNPGRHGIRPLRRALDLDAPSELDLQRRFLALCRDLGLPEPVQEAQVGPYHVDFLWPEAGLAVETDGRSHHERRAAFARDRQRDVDLAARGIQTLRVTWRQVRGPDHNLVTALRGRLTEFGKGSLPLSLS